MKTKKINNKVKKGNILLTMLISMLVVTTIFSLYVSYARDKRNSNLSIERMSNKIELNKYNVAAQVSIYDYLSKYEIPITYTQMISGEGENIVVHRVSVTNPCLVDLNDVIVENINNEKDKENIGKLSYLVLREQCESEIAGYKYNVKIALNIPKTNQSGTLNPTDYESELRIDNFFKESKNVNEDEDGTNFWEDNSLIGNSTYSIELKDIPIYLILKYGMWEQRIECIIRGAKFERELFPIITNPENGYPVGLDGTSINLNSIGTVRGFITLNNAEFIVLDSYRLLKK